MGLSNMNALSIIQTDQIEAEKGKMLSSDTRKFIDVSKPWLKCSDIPRKYQSSMRVNLLQFNKLTSLPERSNIFLEKSLDESELTNYSCV